jgi:hypothetical protein
VHKRKRQFLIEDCSFIDFAGPMKDPEFDYSRPNYLGEWSKEKVYSHLTEYANLVLLSSAEVAPMVTCEALMSGLGVVVSESASANLDLRQPFIDVIPEERLQDKDYVRGAIRRNQETAIARRKDIREYAVKCFDWEPLVRRYVDNLELFLCRARNKPV